MPLTVLEILIIPKKINFSLGAAGPEDIEFDLTEAEGKKKQHMTHLLNIGLKRDKAFLIQ